jgi:hypothetical protein
MSCLSYSEQIDGTSQYYVSNLLVIPLVTMNESNACLEYDVLENLSSKAITVVVNLGNIVYGCKRVLSIFGGHQSGYLP